ncbi:MAG TPA: META domain-containing protein [Burkholderiales bacterium]|nr:META domain-containing protein [Burkholderiales bacterium]
MTARNRRVRRLLAAASLAIASAACGAAASAAGPTAAPDAMAVYRGEARAADSPGRRIELQLRADGSMSLLTDYRNNRAPVVEEGRWNAVSLDQIDIVIERRNGAAVEPSAVHFSRRGDVLQTTPESAQRYGSQGIELKRTKSASVVAVNPILAPPDTNGLWRWEGMVGASDIFTVDHPERYTLELQPGGKAAIRADCNRGQASYKLDGHAFAIKASAMTKAACPPGSLADRYLKALESVNSQRQRADQLFLDLPGGAGTMRFVRAK